VILFINGTLFLLRTSTRAPRSLRIVVSYYIILLIRYVQVVIQPARVSLLLSSRTHHVYFFISSLFFLSWLYFVLFFGFYVFIYFYERSSFVSFFSFMYSCRELHGRRSVMDSILYCLFLTFILTMYYVPVILLFPYSFDPHLLGLVSTPGDT
jgi:hypothetical protein